MRTTVTLDDDLVARLKRSAHDRGVSFKSAINEAIRSGLDNPPQPRPFRVEGRRMGPAKLDLRKALQLAAHLDDEESIRELHRGR